MVRATLYALVGITVFLGAFLLFAIQPIAGKQLLPLFGGSSSVWATSLTFFTAMLFVGYLYVYALSTVSPRLQVVVHLSLLAGGLLLAFVPFSASSVIRALFTVSATEMPVFEVLITLLLTIGVPFFLLSTTGPLMQYWWGVASKKEPYRLYALSNVASLVALLGYPFIIEPLLSLRHQRAAWAVLFLAYAAACTAAAVRFLRTHPVLEAQQKSIGTTTLKALVWISLAALPAFTLVAVTTEITQQITPVPLLWIVPLALYLLSFIVAFGGWGKSIFVPLFFFASVGVAWWFAGATHETIVFQILSYLVLLLFCGLSCHVLLYRARPKTEALPLFYVLLSFGGALGVLLASLIAPLVFFDYFEFPVALALSGALATWILPTVFFPRILDARKIILTKVLFIALVVTFFVVSLLPDDERLAVSTRNFYGNAKVLFDGGLVFLQHGTTLHGAQFMSSENARLPTTYYGLGSGIGRAILYEHRERAEAGVRVGVVGLGTGTIAVYCRPGDTYTFYEIDQRIEEIARSRFSYLAHCGGAEVRIGDGRIVLESEQADGDLGAYDILAVDAFSDDTIPVHLLTREAFETYTAHLRSDSSILAIHVSNRYLNLSPIVFRLAAELGMNAMRVEDSGASTPAGSPSLWLLLAKDPNVFTSISFANANFSPPERTTHVWTDDYSSLLSVLDLPKPWD